VTRDDIGRVNINRVLRARQKWRGNADDPEEQITKRDLGIRRPRHLGAWMSPMNDKTAPTAEAIAP